MTLTTSVTTFPSRQTGMPPRPTTFEPQRTLYGSAECSGVGVHSGATVNLRLLPAPVDNGIVFIRTDLPPGQNRIPAQWDKVVDTRLCTVLGNAQGATVGTVEHLLAALRAMNIDNACIELDGPEIPIMDGSAAPFVLLVEMAGILEQDAPRQWLQILKPVVVQHGDKTASLTPSDQPSFTVEIMFKSAAIARQRYDFTVNPYGFKGEISRARTFGFLEEVDQLRKLGLARGGSLQNAIVISGDRVMNDGGLRYTDEFVRHKLLDAVGDLSLTGMPILGNFSGYCTGHALNNQLLHALFSDRAAWRFIQRPDLTAMADLAAE